MSQAGAAAARSRGERRRAHTRTALIAAAQRLLAENRTDVPVLEITQLADVSIGSFYNHFGTKEELFHAAVEEALEAHGALLDAWSDDQDDPAETFARSFRLTGRIHRAEPELSRVVLSQGLKIMSAEQGLGPRALRDITRGCASGRFTAPDPYVAFLVAAGGALSLGQTLHDHPEWNDAEITDTMTQSMLCMLGLDPTEAVKICSAALPDVRRLLPPSAS